MVMAITVVMILALVTTALKLGQSSPSQASHHEPRPSSLRAVVAGSF